MPNHFKEKLLSGEPVITAEIAPPKGPDLTQFIEKAETLKDLVDAYNITDNQRAVMRMSPLAPSHGLIQRAMTPIYQVTCRDRNRLAIQSELLSAYALGVETILALTGDSIHAGDHTHAKEVFDLDSIQLLHVINDLNAGVSTAGTTLNGTTDFFSGTTVNPSAVPLDITVDRLKLKIEAGASFIQTQALFSAEPLESFVSATKSFSPPLLAGIFILKSAQTARFLNTKVSGIHIPDTIIEILDKASNPLNEGIAIAADLAKSFLYLSSGIHIMATGDSSSIVQVIKIIKKLD